MKNIMHLGSISELKHKICELKEYVTSYYNTMLKKVSTWEEQYTNFQTDLESMATRVDVVEEGKQDTLSAGDGITISGNVISSYVTDTTLNSKIYNSLLGNCHISTTFTANSNDKSGYSLSGRIERADTSTTKTLSIIGYLYDSTGNFVTQVRKAVMLVRGASFITFDFSPDYDFSWDHSKIIIGSNLGGVTEVYDTIQGIYYETHNSNMTTL